MVGDAVGKVVGDADGIAVDGARVNVGEVVGSDVSGDAVGCDVVGDTFGLALGFVVGEDVAGAAVGPEVTGAAVGDDDTGATVGDLVNQAAQVWPYPAAMASVWPSEPGTVV